MPPGWDARSLDLDHVFYGGHNYVRVPCPPLTTQTSWTGPFIGGQAIGSFSHVSTSEYLAATGLRTNSFNDSGSGFGVGVNAGYNWQLWANSAVVGVAADANFLDDRVKRSFAGGSSISSTIDFAASAMARAGVLATPDLLLFAQAGVSFADQKLKITFGGPVTNENKITPGLTLGGGAEWRMGALGPEFAHVSIFADYRHTWWSTATLNMPAASRFFNYQWKRNTDAVTLGFRYRW